MMWLIVDGRFMTRGLVFSRRFVKLFWNKPLVGIPDWVILAYRDYEMRR
jgi:hypothetical protein